MLWILASFLVCGSINLVCYYKYRNWVVACEITSQAHHGLVAVVGAYLAFLYRHSLLAEGALGASVNFPMVTELQHINIGYFLYDTIHCLIWDHKFIAHHLTVLSGFGISEYAGCFALANAVNTCIAEVGSLMYNQYNKHKTLTNYKIFVGFYTVSRTFFLIWSIFLVYQCFNYTGPNAGNYPVWVPYAGSALQLGILVVNIQFLMVHAKKLKERMIKDE